MKTTSLLIALMFAVLANFATPAAAITPLGHHITGTIQTVDASEKEAQMLPQDNATPVTFVWNKLTTFVTAASMTDATILKKGARVEVILHRPFFGKPFVAKVTLLQTNKRK